MRTYRRKHRHVTIGLLHRPHGFLGFGFVIAVLQSGDIFQLCGNACGKLVRRPVIFYNITYGVNNHVSSNRQLATYLFLQWAGAAKPYTQLTFNPAGYQDPHHSFSLSDSYVISSYKKTTVDAFKQIIPRTAPPITIRGGSEYRQALSDQIQNVLTKQSTPEQMAALDGRFHFSDSGNNEVLFAWLQKSVDAHYRGAYPAVERFLVSQGRRRYLKPVYEKLVRNGGDDLAFAKKIYGVARPTYHPVSQSAIDEILRGK